MVESREKELIRLLETIGKRRARRVATTMGVSGRRNEILTSAGQGRYVKYRQAEGTVKDIAILPTIKAAIMRSPGKKKIRIRKEDFREKIRRKKTSSLICLVIDTSSSMLGEGRAATAKSLLQEVLLDIYQKRDRVGVITFYGEGAETILQFTTNVDEAKDKIEAISFGGTSPLGKGLLEGYHLIRKKSAREVESVPIMIVFTDCEPNASVSAGADIRKELKNIFNQITEDNIFSILLDMSDGSKELKKLSKETGWRYLNPQKDTTATDFMDYSVVEEIRDMLMLNHLNRNVGSLVLKGFDSDLVNTLISDLKEMNLDLDSVRGCQFHCNPADPDNLCFECQLRLGHVKETLPIMLEEVPVIKLPEKVTEKQLTGNIYIRYITRPGILTRSNRGYLYIKDIDHLDDHTANLIADVMDTKECTIRGKDVEVKHPCDFNIIATLALESGNIHPRLRKHFSTVFERHELESISNRIKSMRYRKEFETDPVNYLRKVDRKRKAVGIGLIQARGMMRILKISDEERKFIKDYLASTFKKGYEEAFNAEYELKRIEDMINTSAAYTGKRAITKNEVLAGLQRYARAKSFLEPEIVKAKGSEVTLMPDEEINYIKDNILLSIINNRVGHILIEGFEEGLVQQAINRLLQMDLTILTSDNCQFNCDPQDLDSLCYECRMRMEYGDLGAEVKPFPVVDMPENPTHKDLIGELYLKHVVRPGIFAKAHRGLLIIRNLHDLKDNIINSLADAMASKINLVEKEGEYLSHPVNFVTLALKKEGEVIDPRLCEQFSLLISRENLETVYKSGSSLISFISEDKESEVDARKIHSARSSMMNLTIPPSELDFVVRVCSNLGTLGNIIESRIVETAITLASLKGHMKVEEKDTHDAIELIVPLIEYLDECIIQHELEKEMSEAE